MLPCSNDEQKGGESEPLIPWKGEPAIHSPFCYAKGGASPPAAWAPPRELIGSWLRGRVLCPLRLRPLLLVVRCSSTPLHSHRAPAFLFLFLVHWRHQASSSPPRRRLHPPARHIVLSHHAPRCSPHSWRSVTRSRPVARAAVAGSGSADASPVPLTSALHGLRRELLLSL